MKSRMNRLVSWLLVIAMLAVLPVTAMADADGYHSHNDWKVEHHDPTCYEDGYDVRVCNVCGYREERVNVVPAHHKFDFSNPDKCFHEAENGNAGYWLFPCSVEGCTATMKVIDHITNEPPTQVVVKDENGEPKKDAAGNEITETVIHHNSNYNEGHTMSDPMAGGEGKYWAPTCVSDGYKAEKCAVDGCGYIMEPVKVANKTGHSWVRDEYGNEWKVLKEATGTTLGLKERTCSICGGKDTAPIDYLKPQENKPETLYNSATVKNDIVYLYDDINGAAQAVLLKGSRFYIHTKSEDGTWYQIETSKGEKWVKASDMVENAAVGSIPASAYAEALYYGQVTGAGGIKVRAGASYSSAVISSVAYGTSVAVYDASGDWWRISLTEEKWVNGMENGRMLVDVKPIVLGIGTDINAPGYEPPETMEDPSGAVGGPDVVIATGTVSSFTPLNVRKEAKISILNQIGSLARGTTVEIYEKTEVNGHEWGRIKYKDDFGWVCLDHVTITSTNETETVITASPNATIVNVATTVNVRKEPDASTPLNILGRLPLGTRVAVTKYEIVNGKNWYYADKKGWIFQDYIKLDSGVLEALKGGATGETPLTRYANVSVPAVVVSTTELRASASANGTILMTVSPDEDVSLTVTDRTLVNGTMWCKLSIGGVTGWVQAKGLSFPDVAATVSAENLNVYAGTNADGGILGTLPKNSRVVITEQYTDGLYLWGKLRDTVEGKQGWVQMHNLTSIARASTNEVTYISVSIPAKVVSTPVALRKLDGNVFGDTLLTLYKNNEFTINGLMNMDGKFWGRVTVGDYTGWIELDLPQGRNDDNTKQDSITGTVSVDSVNLYKNPSTANTVEKILRKGQKVTVLKRVGLDNNIWGMLRIDSKNYWCNLSGITLAGQTAAPQTPSNPTTPGTPGTSTTPTTPSVSTSAPGTIVCAKTVNIRKAAGVANPLVTTLANGTKVTVYEQTTVDGALWGRIDQGWVALEYVDLSTKPNAGTTTGGNNVTNTILTTVPSGSVAVGFVNTADLAVRSGAGQGYAKVSSLTKGTNVVIHEQQLSDGMIWGRIDQGWICTSYVTLTGIGNSTAGSAGIIKGCFYTANVRSAPGVGNALVGKVMVNSPVVIYEQKEYSGEMWGRTDIGWIAMQYVLIGSIPGI